MFPGVHESLSLAIRRFLSPPEHRPKHEIEAEIREEIEFHLAMTTERIVQEERLDSEQAKSEALHRFGDPDTITRECTRIALKERIMLQRINTALIALVAIGLVIFGVSTLQQQARTNAAFEQINEKLTGLASSQTEIPPVASEPERAQPEPVVYVEKYDGSGADSVPFTEGMTVAVALRAALGDSSPVPVEQLRVNVVRWTDQNEEIVVLRDVPATTDFELRPLHSIVVTGTSVKLPWVLYSPSADDQTALETAASRMFIAGSEFGDEVTVENIFERCAEELGLALEIDTDDLHESEHSLSRPVSTEFAETLTLAEAMDFACHIAVYVNFNKLLWDIHEGTLIVGPAQAIAERALVTSTYRVDELLGPFPTPQDRQDLRETIQMMVGFDHWREYGGDFGIYTEIDSRISITTIPGYHRSITSILQSLRDPQQQYPRVWIQDKYYDRISEKVILGRIDEQLTAKTPIIEAIQSSLEGFGLPRFIAFTELESIGFKSSRPIGRKPSVSATLTNHLDGWLRQASPNDYDRAHWMAYGGGIIISSAASLDSITTTRTYDLSALELTSDHDFVDSIVDLIQTRVDHDGWRDKGGSTGIISAFRNLLVIQTAEAHHRAIFALLDEYRSKNSIGATSSSPDRVVYISGGVQNPGVYQLALDSTMTVRQLIEAAGGYTIQPDSAQIAVTRTYADTGASRTWNFGPKHHDISMPLEPGMSVAISGEPPRQPGEPAPFQSQDLTTANTP
ncbi:MAG: SLBB domain-containing protein [Phycisphaerales bacterium JB050]